MTKGTIINGFIWRFLERCGAQGVTLIVSIVLARLLNPDLYGTISLIMVFITIMEVFVDSGFGNALIQKKDADETDFSSVFYFNLFFGITLYLLMFLIAPAIANFYSNSAFTAYIRVLSIVVVIASVKNIQIAYVSRNMLFKKFFFATIIGTVISGFIGILMAYYGFGVWAIIVQNLSNTFLDTCILWITVKWRPTKKFCYNRFIKLYAFAWKLLVTSLIDTAYQKIRQLIIGKIYSTSDLPCLHQKFRKLRIIFLIAIMFSAAIEITQYFTGRGLCEFDDVFNNTLGACIGFIIWKKIKPLRSNFSMAFC